MIANNTITNAKINDLTISDGKIHDVAFSKITGVLLNNLAYFVDNFLSGSKLLDNSVSNGKIISVDYSKLTNITYDINNFPDNTIANSK